MRAEITLGHTAFVGDFLDDLKEGWGKFTEDRSITRYQASTAIPVYDQVANLLKKYISDPNVLQFATLQVMFETNGLKSHVSQADNNLSGIIFLNKPSVQLNATQGTKRPASEGGYYAHFKTQADWAKDFVRILSIGKQPPIKATTLRDFVDRLKANHYFTANADLYYRGLATLLAALPKAQALKAQNDEIAKDINEPWYDKLADLAKAHPAAAVAVGFGGLIILKKLMD